MLSPWKESYDQPREHIKKQRHYFVSKGPYSQGYGFSSGHVWMWELDYKEGWARKNWCFWTVVLQKTLESALDCKEIQPVHPQGDQSWVFIGRTDVEAKTPILWPPDAKSWLIWKDPNAGKDWGREEKGMTKNEMVGWHHWLNGHGFGWTLGVGDGQGGLACCGSWGHKESDTTERLNWTKLNVINVAVCAKHNTELGQVKRNCIQTSLVTQWIRICLPMQRTRLWSQGQKIPHATGQLSSCIRTIEPVLCNKRNHSNEKPLHCN